MQKLLVFLLFAGSFYSHSQEIRLKGMVMDSLQNPLVFASVMATKQSDQSTVFSATNEDGSFELVLSKGSDYLFKIFFMGYETFEQTVNFSEDTQSTYFLREAPTYLEEVILNFERPITVKKDTTSYKVAYFNLGDERKLKDVLSNLPGIEVLKNGDVLFKGIKVNRLLVEDRIFFNGGTKLGVENIPSDAISQIDILENYNEIDFLKGLNNTESIALNVKLKEGKKEFVFGDLLVGLGEKPFKSFGTNLFYYAEKETMNVISDINNVGKEVFTLIDYLQFTTKINEVFSGDFSFQPQDFKILMDQKDFISNHQRFGALNISKTISYKLKGSSYVMVHKIDALNKKEQINTFDQFVELYSGQRNTDSFFLVGELKLNYTPNKNWQLNLVSNYRQNKLEEFGTESSFTNLQEMANIFNTEQSFLPKDYNNHLEVHAKINDKQKVSLFSGYQHHQNQYHELWNAPVNLFPSILPIENQENTAVSQLIARKTNHFQFIFKHFWTLNSASQIHTTLNSSSNAEVFSSSTSQILDNQSLLSFNTVGFNNQLEYILKQQSMKISYKMKLERLLFIQYVAASRYTWQISQSNLIKDTKWLFLPSTTLSYQLDASKELRFNYSVNTSFSDATHLSNMFYIRSYNSFYRGNEFLENDLNHVFSLNYKRSKLFKGETFYSFLRYSKAVRGFTNTIQFQDQYQFLTRILLDNAEEKFSLNTYYNRKSKFFRWTLSTILSNDRFFQDVNGVFKTNRSRSINTNFFLETRFKNYPNIKLGVNNKYSEFFINGKNTYVTNKYYLGAKYQYLKTFDASLSYKRFNFLNKNIRETNTFDHLDVTLNYTPERSPWSFGISGNNLLNISSRRASNFSPLNISDSRTFIMPRIILFQVNYKL